MAIATGFLFMISIEDDICSIDQRQKLVITIIS